MSRHTGLTETSRTFRDAAARSLRTSRRVRKDYWIGYWHGRYFAFKYLADDLDEEARNGQTKG